jgi:hypothetical protein
MVYFTTPSVSGLYSYIAQRYDDKLMYWEGFGRKRSGPTTPIILLGELGKITKTLVRTADPPN